MRRLINKCGGAERESPDECQEIVDMPFDVDLVCVGQLFDGIGPGKYA
jgi:hypothetical protein